MMLGQVATSTMIPAPVTMPVPGSPQYPRCDRLRSFIAAHPEVQACVNAGGATGIGIPASGVSGLGVATDPRPGILERLNTWALNHPRENAWLNQHPHLKHRLINRALSGLGQSYNYNVADPEDPTTWAGSRFDAATWNIVTPPTAMPQVGPYTISEMPPINIAAQTTPWTLLAVAGGGLLLLLAMAKK